MQGILQVLASGSAPYNGVSLDQARLYAIVVIEQQRAARQRAYVVHVRDRADDHQPRLGETLLSQEYRSMFFFIKVSSSCGF